MILLYCLSFFAIEFLKKYFSFFIQISIIRQTWQPDFAGTILQILNYKLPSKPLLALFFLSVVKETISANLQQLTYVFSSKFFCFRYIQAVLFQIKIKELRKKKCFMPKSLIHVVCIGISTELRQLHSVSQPNLYLYT